MKKNFLFKWVSVLGAILLLANVALPGMVAYADGEVVKYNSEKLWDDFNSESMAEEALGFKFIFLDSDEETEITKW